MRRRAEGTYRKPRDGRIRHGARESGAAGSTVTTDEAPSDPVACAELPTKTTRSLSIRRSR